MSIETPERTTDFEVLRILIDMREHVLQKNRIALGNRLSAIERGVDEVDENTHRIINRFFTSFERLESDVDDEIKALVKQLPIVQAMTNVKGIGPMLAARVVSMIDIRLVGHVSALWKWAGYSVNDGIADKPRKGEPITYNPRLKKTVYLVGESFLKSRSPYRDIYDHWKEEYTRRNMTEQDQIKLGRLVEQRKQLEQDYSVKSHAGLITETELEHHIPPGTSLDAYLNRIAIERKALDAQIKEIEETTMLRTPLHIHNMAMRKMTKLWLSHLWQVWRELEGLPVVDAYVHQHMGHTTRITPGQMGW